MAAFQILGTGWGGPSHIRKPVLRKHSGERARTYKVHQSFRFDCVCLFFATFKTHVHTPFRQRARPSLHSSGVVAAIRRTFLWGFTEQNVKIVSLKFQLAVQLKSYWEDLKYPHCSTSSQPRQRFVLELFLMDFEKLLSCRRLDAKN